MSIFDKYTRYLGETDDEFRTRIIGDANARQDMVLLLAKLGLPEARRQLRAAGFYFHPPSHRVGRIT